MLVVDGTWVIRDANRSATEVFGADLNSGMASFSNLWLPENGATPEEFVASAEQFRKVLGPVKLMGEGGETLSYHISACSFSFENERFFLLQLLPLPSSSGGDTKGESSDMGRVHKEKLDRALQLTRTIALDFNNALTSVLGHTSLVISKLEVNHPWRNSLVEVEKAAAKAAETANDLANFSRQEKDKDKEKDKETKGQPTCNVNVLLQRNVETLESTAPQMEKEINWSLQLDQRLHAAKFDEAKLQQALLKIMENAVEALGPRGEIILRTKNIQLTHPTQDRDAQLVAGAYVCVEIVDNGSGIEPNVLPRIFEPFFTTKRSSRHRGLGLPWVYGVVTSHSGTLAVSSEPGAGTSVRVYLRADRKIATARDVAATDLNGNQTILMVDDEDLLLTMGQTILSAYGYRVLVANSGQKAIDLLSKWEKRVDLLMTDLIMPGMSGRELVEQVRRLSPQTRVLCSSGYIRPSSEESESIAFLQKPFTSQELLLKVKQVLSAQDSMPVD